MDCLVFQQRVYLEVIDICAVWLNLKCGVWNACAYWWVIYHIMWSLLKYFEDKSRHSSHCFKHTMYFHKLLHFPKYCLLLPGLERVLRHFSIEYWVFSIYLVFIYCGLLKVVSLVCWKCWGVLHINNLLLGHFGPSKTITMMAIMLKWTQYLQRWWTNFTQGTSDTQWQIYNWDYKVKRWSIRQRQRSLTALWYEKFIFPPAPQSDAQLVAVLGLVNTFVTHDTLSLTHQFNSIQAMLSVA